MSSFKPNRKKSINTSSVKDGAKKTPPGIIKAPYAKVVAAADLKRKVILAARRARKHKATT